MNKSKKLFSILVIVFLSVQLFAQSFDDEEFEWLIPEENTELKVEDSLQTNFIIIEDFREHELNPQLTSYASDAQFLTGLYEGLFSYNPLTLDPVYAVAVDFRISRDKKRWNFKINPKAYFSNGEKITAQSVRESWIQLLASPQAPYSSLLDIIQGAKDFREGRGSENEVGIYANSEDELSIHLTEPANYLPKVLCHPAFSVISSKPQVYSGPYYLDQKETGIYILKKNPYYWDKENVHLEQITFVQSGDGEENSYCYNTGLADWITGSADTNRIINKKSLQLNAMFATSYFFFKTIEAKSDSAVYTPWDFIEFRNALFEAIPWDSLRENFYYPSSTFVYPLTGYPRVEGYSFTDKEEAKILMRKARDIFGIDEDVVLPLVLEVNENVISEDKINLLKNAFAELGVDFQVITKPYEQYLDGIGQSDADMFFYSWIGDFADPLAFLELFRGNSTLNESGWWNSEYDALLKKAAEVSEEERYKLLAQAEEILLDNYMVIPIQNPVAFNVINTEEVGGWSINAFDIHPLKYLYKKNVKSKLRNVVIK